MFGSRIRANPAGTIAAELPAYFWTVPYVGERYPGAPGVPGIAAGANCQQYAYEVLRYFGFQVPDLRSSELWNDTGATVRVAGYEPLDLLLFNGSTHSYGAHVGVYIGAAKILHLCREVGKPVVWPVREFAAHPEYSTLVGAKRCLTSRRA